MDPITTAVLATAIAPLVSGAAGEAGKHAWQSLVVRSRSLLRRDSTAAQEVEVLDAAQDDAEQVPVTADSLAAEAADNPELEQWLRHWLTNEAQPAAGNVTNIVSGQVNTAVIGRDFHGGINITR